MTAPLQGAAEADKAAIAFQLALTKIGVKTLAEALKLWQHVPPTKVAEVQQAWLDQAVRLIMGRRALSRDLAVAYYRLARALRTGTTIPDPRNPLPTHVTLAELRWEFERMTEQADHPDEAPAKAPAGPTRNPPTFTRHDGSQAPQADDLKDIPIEPVKGIDENGDSTEEQIEKEAEQEARIVLTALGPNALKNDVGKIDTTRPADEVDQQREDAHKQAGARQAAAVERITLNGGRSTTWSLMERDSREVAWIRISTTGTPCGWCAMLISRGAVYRSAHTAQYGDDGDLYHDNCHCIAEPVFTRSQVQSDRYALNREYGELWPVVTKGLSGKAAVSAWRRFIRQRMKTQPTE